MYKIILWFNDDMADNLSYFHDYDHDNILIIGDGVRVLSEHDLILTDEQKARIDSSTQLVFLSHGGYGGALGAVYNIESSLGYLDGRTVLSKILSNAQNLDNGITCHIASCFGGFNLVSMDDNPYEGVMNEIPERSTIFFHGGLNVSRQGMVNDVLSIIKHASLHMNLSSVEDRLYMAQKSMLESGMVGVMQHLGHMNEIDDLSVTLSETSNASLPRVNMLSMNYYVNMKVCSDVQNFVEKPWREFSDAIEHKMGIVLDRNIERIDPFEYIMKSYMRGALLLDPSFLLQPHSADNTLENMRSVESMLLNTTDQIVDSLFNLTINQTISLSQYHHIIAYMLVFLDGHIEGTLKVSSHGGFMKQYYSALMKHGVDFMAPTHDGPMIFTISPQSIELFVDLCPNDLPPLFTRNADDETLISHILSDLRYAAKILNKWAPHFIDVNFDDQLRQGVIKAISTLENNNIYDLEKIFKHLKDIDILPGDIPSLHKIWTPKYIDFILSKASSRGLNLNGSACILEDKEEYTKKASYADIKLGMMDKLRRELEEVKDIVKFNTNSVSEDEIIKEVSKQIDILHHIASECAAYNKTAYNIDPTSIKESFSQALYASANPLEDLMNITEVTLEPLFAELRTHRNVKEVIEHIMVQKSKILLLYIAESFNAAEVMPVFLKYSADIDLSADLILGLSKTHQASKIMPMILDKASVWRVDLSMHLSDGRVLQDVLQAEHPDVLHVMEGTQHVDSYVVLGDVEV